ncbi:MAG: NADAR family protein [Cyanobacteria bacterium P01_H01_bin.119]
MTIYFYTAREVPYGCFSNFSRHGVLLDERWWPTVEHYFQAQKFMETAPDWADKIGTVPTPKDAARMGRDRRYPLRADWEQVKDSIMHRAVLTKFRTHPEIRAVLLGTGNEAIVENAPGDYYWGCGQDGSGLNRLGRILETVRSALAVEEDSGC